MAHPAVEIIDGMLKCNRCGEAKATSEFPKRAARKCGFDSECRECKAGRFTKFYSENRSQQVRRASEWAKKNHERHLQNKRKYYAGNRKEILKSQKRYSEKNAAKRSARYRAWCERNTSMLKAKRRAMRKDNPEIVKRWDTRAARRKRATPEGRILVNYRSRLWQALVRVGGRKSKRTLLLIGCTAKELRAYIETLWLPGMSWGNYGEWHIDHIRPCASFDLTDAGEQSRCFHFTNLQPLWAIDNLKKADKINLN